MSGELAKVLRDWLPSVIQAAKPYFSTDDIEKGTRGNTMLAKELEEAGIGILCLTRENLEASWIMFEAGALSKSLDKSRVCPILFGSLGTTDLQGPLTNFQAAKFNKEEMHKVISTINTQLGDAALGPKTLDTVFEKWWPDLDEKVKDVLSKAPKDTKEKVRGDRELLEEILTLARQIPALGRSYHDSQVGGTLTYNVDALEMASALLLVMTVDKAHDIVKDFYGIDDSLTSIVIKQAQLQELWKLTSPKDKGEEITSEVKKLAKTEAKKK